MKKIAVWFILIIILAATAYFATTQSGPAATFKQTMSPGPLSPHHAYIGNRCELCHQPYVGVTVANCTSCHANAKRLLSRQPTAFHASIEECSACHVEHQKASIRPRVMDHVELAKIGARTLERASDKDAESSTTLNSLKTWLRMDSLDELDPGSALETLNCAGCHDLGEPHFQRFGSDCAQCHRFESWSVPGYQHPSSKSKVCVQCHQAPPSHFMGHFSMVSKKIAGKEHARVDQCFECHNTTSWNDIVGVGFYKHH